MVATGTPQRAIFPALGDVLSVAARTTIVVTVQRVAMRTENLRALIAAFGRALFAQLIEFAAALVRCARRHLEFGDEQVAYPLVERIERRDVILAIGDRVVGHPFLAPLKHLGLGDEDGVHLCTAFNTARATTSARGDTWAIESG